MKTDFGPAWKQVAKPPLFGGLEQLEQLSRLRRTNGTAFFLFGKYSGFPNPTGKNINRHGFSPVFSLSPSLP